MDNTNCLMKVLEAIHQLFKKITHKRFRKSLAIDIDQAEKFSIFCKIHDEIANRTSSLHKDYLTLLPLIRNITTFIRLQPILLCERVIVLTPLRGVARFRTIIASTLWQQ